MTDSAFNSYTPKHAAKTTAGPWIKQAACRGVDADLFFPARGESTRAARQVCQDCPVRLQCLEYSLANKEVHGIWGGLSERERRRIRSQRNAARKVAS